MALGNSQIANINMSQESMSTGLVGLEDCWNTFNYVTKGLDEWASETVIGNEVKENSRILSNCLETMIQELKSLYEEISAFKEKQIQINKGNGGM